MMNQGGISFIPVIRFQRINNSAMLLAQLASGGDPAIALQER
jgi:hypothetical protein